MLTSTTAGYRYITKSSRTFVELFKMKTLRLAYHSMWPDHDPEKQPRDFFRWCLEQHYLVEIDNINPDIVILAYK